VAVFSTLPAANPALEPAASPRPANLLRLWHLTSLDAPTVAVTWCLAFAHVVEVRLPLWLPIVLGLAAWVFYIGDRLLDARKALRLSLSAPLQARHRFHWKHRRLFLPVAIAAGLAGLAMVLYFMPAAARPRNTLLTAAALAYLSSVHAPSGLPRLLRALHLPKELLVGLIFTAACALPVWSRMSSGRLAFLPVFLVFSALAWLNCEAIETWESAPAWLRHPARITPLSILLAAASLALAGPAMLLHQPRSAALLTAAGVSSLAIALLDRRQRRIDTMDPITLRAAADLVLLTPLALFFLP